MNNRAIKFFSISGMLILVGCVSQPTLPGAQSILLVNQSPDSEDCTLLGGISSSQGNMLSGGMVSDDNLITAVKNDMRNQTYLLGGNVVYIQELKLNALYAMSTNNASVQAKAFNCNNKGLVLPSTGADARSLQSSGYLVNQLHILSDDKIEEGDW